MKLNNDIFSLFIFDTQNAEFMFHFFCIHGIIDTISE